MDGQTGQSRFPSGFLLVDKGNNKAWVYDWDGEQFTVRDPDGAELSTDGRMRAANEHTYDVRAV